MIAPRGIGRGCLDLPLGAKVHFACMSRYRIFKHGRRTGIVCCGGLLLGAAAANAADRHEHVSPYRGQESRQIKSLSAADIEELSRGGGWGFAKAAELNGIPGPAHLLELKDQIPLAPEQVVEITALYRDMKNAAQDKGAELIALERALDRKFREGTVTAVSLERMLGEIGKVRSDLRFVHLKTHLKTLEILTSDQIRRYNRLRGCAKAGPCDVIPKGHDVARWRRHNGC